MSAISFRIKSMFLLGFLSSMALYANTCPFNMGKDAQNVSSETQCPFIKKSSSSSTCCRGPQGKRGERGEKGETAPGPSMDGSITYTIVDFPFISGDFTFRVIIASPDGRQVGTDVFSSTALPLLPISLTFDAPIYTGAYPVIVEIVSVNVPGQVDFVGITSNTADTNTYITSTPAFGDPSFVGKKTVFGAFAVP